MISKKIFYFVPVFIISLFFFTTPHASAHEVYVLNQPEINTAITTQSVPPLTTIKANFVPFATDTLITILVVAFVFLLSIWKPLVRLLKPFFERLKRYAPLLSRVTVGLAFIAAAYYRASYGPELPLAATFGNYTGFIVALLYIVGVLLILGLFVRFCAFVALVLFLIAVYFHGTYMLTYTNYLGESILLLIAGAGGFALQKTKLSKETYEKIEKVGFFISRVFFGIALIYASAYAKLIHSNLALETVTRYHLTNYLHFEPHFLVLGAACVEILIGLFFIFGIEIRFTSLFLLFWLTLSLLFFGETVWPHIILIGLPITFICYGYDKYSLETFILKRFGREPVL